MSHREFYKSIFAPIEDRIGCIDGATIVAIIGFDCGGPVSLCTVGHGRETFVTYISCELAVRPEQQPAKFGRYEVMMMCNDEAWAIKILTLIGNMSLDDAFGHGHTVDISQIVGAECPLQGLVAEEFARVNIGDLGYGILLFNGVMRSELEFAMERGSDALLELLKKSGIHPHTDIHRKESVV